MDRYRDRRSPDRERPRYSAPTDSYIPSTSIRAPRPRSRSPGRYRPRSRSPPRLQADTWRGRPRSRTPPRRFQSGPDAYPPRDARPRSPRREYIPADARYEDARFDEGARSARARSPPPALLKRTREASPGGRGVRSPPPAKRERIASPPRDYIRPRSPPRRGYASPPPVARQEYRARSRSPPRRDERADPYTAKSWRRTSPSPRPARIDQRPGDGSGRNSVATSRRSSPPSHVRKPEGYVMDDTRTATAAYRSPAIALSPVPASPRRPVRGPRPPITADERRYEARPRAAPEPQDYPPATDPYPSVRENRVPPTGPSYKDPRAPPTGPSGAIRLYAAPSTMSMSPPLGPSSNPVSMSAHNRGGSIAPPTQPRGASYRGRGGAPMPPRDYPPRDYPPTGPASGRGGRGSWNVSTSYNRGPPATRESGPPREGSYSHDSRTSGPPPARHHDSMNAPPPPNFRSGSNSTSTTYPRSQRFNNPTGGGPQTPSAPTASSIHLADLPAIKPGGERLPPLQDMSKADRLEEEAARLRKAIDEKQERKRAGLREWERLERESKMAGLRTELAEEGLRALSGEGEGIGVGGVAAF